MGLPPAQRKRLRSRLPFNCESALFDDGYLTIYWPPDLAVDALRNCVKDTGPIFVEPPIASDANGQRRERYTNQVCEKLDDTHYLIDGRPIGFPVVVADAAMLMNAFIVDAAAAQHIIRGSGFRVLEVFPGKAILQLLCVDYRKNDLGDYNEGAIIFPVLAPGEARPFPLFGALSRMATGGAGNFVYRMPVDQEFTTHAGRFIWGFPKWMARIDIEFAGTRASGTFYDEGELVYGIAAKAGGTTSVKEQRIASLAIRDGRAWKTYGTNTGAGATFSLGGEMPVIGDTHPLALELRSLGLPKKPLFSVSMTHTALAFSPPESVEIGQPFQ
jgi:Acetoacetate decarboxylase (ADC)